MEKMRAKLKKQGGFTLIEMLIVVAIIAILVAISIPLLGSVLEKARIATDAANERSFKTELVAQYMLTEAGMATTEVQASDGTDNYIYAYDAVNGKIEKADKTGITVYGKNDSIGTDTAKGKILYGYINTDGEVTMSWLAAYAAGGTEPDKDAVDDATDNSVYVTAVAGTWTV